MTNHKLLGRHRIVDAPEAAADVYRNRWHRVDFRAIHGEFVYWSITYVLRHAERFEQSISMWTRHFEKWRGKRDFGAVVVFAVVDSGEVVADLDTKC